MQYLHQTIDPLAVKSPPNFIFRHRSGAEKNPSVPGRDVVAFPRRNCRG